MAAKKKDPNQQVTRTDLAPAPLANAPQIDKANLPQPNFNNPNTSDPMGVFRNQATGGVSGVTLPDGRTFLGLTPDEAQEIINRQNKKTATPEGTLEMSQIARQQEGQQLVGEVGQITPQENIQQEPLNIGQALTEGGRQAAIGAAGAATIGAGITAATGGLA